MNVVVIMTPEAAAIRDAMFAKVAAGTPFDLDAETDRYVEALRYDVA